MYGIFMKYCAQLLKQNKQTCAYLNAYLMYVTRKLLVKEKFEVPFTKW